MGYKNWFHHVDRIFIDGLKGIYEIYIEKDGKKWKDHVDVKARRPDGKRPVVATIPISKISGIKYKKLLFKKKCILSIYLEDGDTSLENMKFDYYRYDAKEARAIVEIVRKQMRKLKRKH